jgi:hypothetical protein
VTSVLALFIGSATAFGQVEIPDTLAGHTLQAFLDAFNSGDRTKIQAYVQTFDPKPTGLDRFVDNLIDFHGRTGGFELLSIDLSEALSIKFKVQEKATRAVVVGAMKVRDAQPATVDKWLLLKLPPGAVVDDVTLDAQSRQRVIDGAITNLFYS